MGSQKTFKDIAGNLPQAIIDLKEQLLHPEIDLKYGDTPPRGILLHYYETDKNGVLVNVNIITPTAQMINNMEADLRQYIGRKKQFNASDKRKLGMLIRAYDPCMTCATH